MCRVRKFVWTIILAVFCLTHMIAVAPAIEQKNKVSLAEELTTLTAREMKRVLPTSSVEIAGPLDLKVTLHGEVWDAYLYNLYLYCQRDIENCGNGIVARAAEFKSAHQEQEQPLLKSNLRVVVRDDAHAEQLEQRYGTEENALVEPITGDLWAIVVEDLPTSVLYPKPAEIKALGLSLDDALKLAMANTKAAARKIVPDLKPKDRGALQVFFGDDFIATFVFPELWASVARTFGGKLVVAVPSTDKMLLIAGDDTPAALGAIQKASNDEWAHAEKPLSRFLYRWSENGWVQIPDSVSPSGLIKVSP